MTPEVPPKSIVPSNAVALSTVMTEGDAAASGIMLVGWSSVMDTSKLSVTTEACASELSKAAVPRVSASSVMPTLSRLPRSGSNLETVSVSLQLVVWRRISSSNSTNC